MDWYIVVMSIAFVAGIAVLLYYGAKAIKSGE